MFFYRSTDLESVDGTTVLGKSSLAGKQLNMSVVCTSECCKQPNTGDRILQVVALFSDQLSSCHQCLLPPVLLLRMIFKM